MGLWKLSLFLKPLNHLHRAGNIWVDANERNAVVVITKDGGVFEVFRNPVIAAGLRNAADTAVGDTRILKFPTSPFLSGKTFCTASLDANRRDNFPRSAGEVDGGNTTSTEKDLGKISCMDQELHIGGPHCRSGEFFLQGRE